MPQSLKYLSGFGNHFESEAIENALAKNQNSPQLVPFGLYAEQLNGSAFTTPRKQNLHSWLYRILPSVKHDEFAFHSHYYLPLEIAKHPTPPTQMRWAPPPYPKKKYDFIESLMPFAYNGCYSLHTGATIYLYACNQSMEKEYFYNADGELLIVPQEGELLFKTEFGSLEVKPREIIVIPRGIKFQVKCLNEQARGYVIENYGSPFTLPERGVIGANGLANTRDFLIPHAAFEELSGDFKLICKFHGNLWSANIDHSPLDVVAWHGNYTPYKYDLTLFNTLGSISYDHPDPSIFTVLTSPSEIPGTANIDFVIFPERWMVAEHTFRPPYYHRNIMNEFMGLIYGIYDAKEEGFNPGGASLHNCFSAHGPDTEAYEKAIHAELKPEHYADTLAFMFESRFVWQPTEFALNAKFRESNYLDCWKGLKRNFGKV